MRTTPTRTRMITAAVAGVAVPTLLVLGAGNSHAEGFNPQPDPPSFSQQTAEFGIVNPNGRRALGGPDTKLNPQPGLTNVSQVAGGAK